MLDGSQRGGLRDRTVLEERSLPDLEEAARDGLTLRAFLIGLVLCAFLAVALVYNRMVIQGSWMNLYFIDRGALFVFFCLVLFANPLLAVLRRRYALTRGELLSIYAMFLVLIPTSGVIRLLLSYLTGVTYYASPERRDFEAVLLHILPWTAPRGARTVRGLYEGWTEGGPPPWEAWVAPLASWGAFLMVLFVVLICLTVILRKQWEEHERFVFPIMQVPLAMGETGPGKVGPLFKNRLMWVGFAIPFLIGTVNALHTYYHLLPSVDLRTQFWIFRRTTPVPVRLSFALLGYTYLVNLDVSLSIWLLNVVSKVIRGILAVFGVDYFNVSGTVSRFSSRGSSVLAFMGMGYMLVLAAYSLWVAREHLQKVAAKVLGRPSPVDDSREVMPYRTAALGILVGTLYLGCWLTQAGISPPLVLLLLSGCFVVFFVMNRIVSETGYVVAYSPLNPAEFAVGVAGAQAFSPSGLVTLGFSFAWTMTRYSNLMPHAQGALRLVREIGRKRGLVWAMGVALAVGLVATSYTTLDLGYTYGGLNLDRLFQDYSYLPFNEFVGRRLLNPSPVFYDGFFYMGLGIGIAGLLTVMRSRLSWWPLHPVALPISTITYTDNYFFTVFIAWGIKALVLRFGGATLYRRTVPFFIGIILGEVVCAGTWGVVDFFTGMVGNMVYID